MLVCCGLVTLDVSQVVDELPRANEKVTARALSVTFGGPAANAAATAAALGVPVLLVTAIGEGAIAAAVHTELRAAGVVVVDVLSGQKVDPPISTVLVTAATGERAVVSVNASREREYSALPAHVLDGARVLLVDGHLPQVAVPLALAARAAGVRVVLDGGSYKPGTEELLAVSDVAVVSDDFALPGERTDLSAVAAHGPSFVARSAGAGPIRVLSNGVVHEVAVPVVGRVVDTLGAGDVLHGAFAAAWHEDLDDPLGALQFAARAATASVGHPGAHGWVHDGVVLAGLRASLGA